jgi:hypothetical protein
MLERIITCFSRWRKRTFRSPGNMKMLERIITFDTEHIAKAIIITSSTTPPSDVFRLMNLEKIPRGILSISGGAGKFPDELVSQTQDLIESVIVPLAYEHDLMIIDGGTDEGIMQLIGNAVEKVNYLYPRVIGHEHRFHFLSRPLLVGFAPLAKVYAPGFNQPTIEKALLNRNHSYFILIADAAQWGEEVDYMSGFINHLITDQRIPTLHVIFNGGRITIKEVYYAVKQQRPVLLLEGSTRAVEIIAALKKASLYEIVQMLLDKKKNIAEEHQLEETCGWLSVIARHGRCIESFDIKSQPSTDLRNRILAHLELAAQD